MGSYAQTPILADNKKDGFLLSDPELEQTLAKCLENFFKDNEKQSSKPFFQCETKITVFDEVFIFKLSFRYEKERIIFDWMSKAIYPSDNYILRKH